MRVFGQGAEECRLDQGNATEAATSSLAYWA